MKLALLLSVYSRFLSEAKSLLQCYPTYDFQIFLGYSKVRSNALVILFHRSHLHSPSLLQHEYMRNNRYCQLDIIILVLATITIMYSGKKDFSAISAIKSAVSGEKGARGSMWFISTIDWITKIIVHDNFSHNANILLLLLIERSWQWEARICQIMHCKNCIQHQSATTSLPSMIPACLWYMGLIFAFDYRNSNKKYAIRLICLLIES